MSIAQKIKERRLVMKLSEAELATSAGLSVSAYGDLEAYEDEWKDVPLGQLKSIANKLQLDVCSLIDPVPPSEQKCAELSRAAAIAHAWAASSKSVATLSNEVGVVESAIHQILSDAAALETWPTEFVLVLSSSLKIPFGTLYRG